jgi:hypothetical protein
MWGPVPPLIIMYIKEIGEKLKNNPGKTISIGTVAALLPLFAFLEDRYVSAAELESAMDNAQKAVFDNRRYIIENELFKLDLVSDDKLTPVQKALKEKYKRDLKDIKGR